VHGTQYVAFTGGLGGPAVIGAPTRAKVEHPPILPVTLGATAALPALATPPANMRAGGAPEQRN
jgi:hypothetical protein